RSNMCLPSRCRGSDCSASRSMREDGEYVAATHMVSGDGRVDEAGIFSQLGEGLGLLIGPPVAGVSRCARGDSTFGGEESSAIAEHSGDFVQRCGEVAPVMDGRQRPRDITGRFSEWQCLSTAWLP